MDYGLWLSIQPVRIVMAVGAYFTIGLDELILVKEGVMALATEPNFHYPKETAAFKLELIQTQMAQWPVLV